VTGGNGVEGLERLKTIKPDLIVLDMNMPVMGGIDFYKNILQEDGRTLYPVLALTARANLEQFFREMNIDGFMAKPFEIPDLVKEIAAIIEKHSGQDLAAAEKKAGGPKKVFIVESDGDFAGLAGASLLMSGVGVNLARSGADAIQRMPQDVPEVACVQMNLPDMPGENVIRRLKSLPATSHVKFILYAFEMAHREAVADKIQHKAGIDKFVTVNSAANLIDAIMTLET
jgi:two-component system chemotaxis response regulator CheY